MKYITIYPEDFSNIQYWYDICDQLELPHNTLVIDIQLTKVAYEDSTEKNVKNY